MGHVTTYLDNEIENKMKHAARENHVSVSKWVANIIKERISTEWPQDIVDLAGSWKNNIGPSVMYWGTPTTPTLLNSHKILTGFKKMIIPYMRLQGLVERIFS